jgi:hypothetical protein
MPDDQQNSRDSFSPRPDSSSFRILFVMFLLKTQDRRAIGDTFHLDTRLNHVDLFPNMENLTRFRANLSTFLRPLCPGSSSAAGTSDAISYVDPQRRVIANERTAKIYGGVQGKPGN